MNKIVLVEQHWVEMSSTTGQGSKNLTAKQKLTRSSSSGDRVSLIRILDEYIKVLHAHNSADLVRSCRHASFAAKQLSSHRVVVSGPFAHRAN
jgi:hypothetical protein